MVKVSKLIGASVASLALTLSMAPMAFAEPVTKLNIEVEPASIDVTIPTEIDMVLHADGTYTAPSSVPIINNSSIGRVCLESMNITGRNGWQKNYAGSDSWNKKQVDFIVSNATTGKQYEQVGSLQTYQCIEHIDKNSQLDLYIQPIGFGHFSDAVQGEFAITYGFTWAN